MTGLISAFRTLTVIRVPGKEAASFVSALPWFPVVGAVFGALLVGVAVLVHLLFPGWIYLCSFLVLGTQIVISGAMHLDGLADAADALFSMKDRQRKLEIMKDSRLGTYGVLTLVCAFAAKWFLIAKLIEADAIRLIVVAMIVSRTVQVELAVTMAYARAGDGTAKAFVTGATRWHRGAAWLSAFLLIAGFGPMALIAIPIAFVAARLLARWFKTEIGGITGDLLGASSELTELIILFFLGAWLHHLPWIDWPWDTVWRHL